MIARTWGGRVPIEHAEGFYRHLLDTGVADYSRQPGCVDVQLWRRTSDRWAHFVLCSIWVSMEAIRSYAGDRPELAAPYPKDDAFQMVPDITVTHYDVLGVN